MKKVLRIRRLSKHKCHCAEFSHMTERLSTHTVNYEGNSVEVDEKVAEFLEADRKRGEAESRSDRRHLAKYELTENTYDALLDKPVSLIDDLINAEEVETVRNAINTLTETQKRRVKMYFFDNLTFAQIAEMEEASYPVVRWSILSALKIIKNLLG